MKRGKPIANTGVASDLTTSSVKISGTATFDSGYAITQKGICWDTAANPTLLKSIGHSQEGAGKGSFISSVANLIENKQYYYCAYATNEAGTSYGEVLVFTTNLNPVLPTVTTATATNITQTIATSGGNITSDGGATVTSHGVCWSAAQNPTISGSHTNDGSGTGVFTSAISGLTANTTYYVRAYATNSVGTSYGNEVIFTTLAWICGSSITINHVTGTVAPVTKTVTYGTVTNIPGEPAKCWITSNLGADHQATAVDDATEASAGWYWQFNRKQGYQYKTSRTPATTWDATNDNLSSTWEAAKDPCTIELGTGWRIPTATEWNNVDASWTNWTGPFGSALKLHAAGYLYYSVGSLTGRGSIGFYWSSTQAGVTDGFILAFSNSSSTIGSNVKAYGFTLRCVRDY